MKIMSFNTQHCQNYITKKIDFEIMAKTITNLGADVVGLNEMRGEGQDPEYTEQVKKLASLTGMQYHYFAPAIDIPNRGLYGNGLLSKIPILKAETVAIPNPISKKYRGYYEPRCVLKALLEGNVTVLVSHFGLNPDEQENAVQTIVEHIADQKCIVMGDFNVVPDAPVLLPIRKKMRDTADSFKKELFSFPSDVPTRKIDYIFVSPDIEVLAADLPPIVASDHRPHTAEIRL